MTAARRWFSTHAARSAAALVAAVALAAPGAARAASKTFSAGSLIIPASIEYQSNDGLIATYAFVYAVLAGNAQRTHPVKFYWAISPNKLSPYRCDTMHNDPRTDAPFYERFNDNDGCDFAVVRTTANGGQPVSLVNAAGQPVAPFNVNDLTYDNELGPQRANSTHSIGSSTQMVKYLGGSWIVDSTDAEVFLALLRDTASRLAPFHANGTNQPNNASRTGPYVNVHWANADFTAPVTSVLKQAPPKIALVGSNGQTDKLVDVLVNAGLCGSSGYFRTATGGDGCPGTVYDDFTSDPGQLLGDGTSTANRLNNADPNAGPIYGLLWLGDGAFGTGNPTIPPYQRTTIETFLGNKGNVFAEYNTIGAMEGGFYQSTSGVVPEPSAHAVAPNEDCNDSNSFNFFRGGGTGCVIYKGVTLPYAQAGNFYYEMGGNGNWQGYRGTFRQRTGSSPGTLAVVQEGPTPGVMIASASYYQGDTNKGLIMYLAGHKYDQPPKFWGERIILNTVFARLVAPSGTELSRSEPVAFVNSKTDTAASGYQRVYQGTYVEQLLPDVTEIVTYDATNPTVWIFPYMNGHLYQYDLGTLTTTAQSFNFSPQTTTPDAGYLLQAGTPMPHARTIWTYVDARTGNATGPAPSGPVGWQRIDFKYTQVTSGCAAGADGVCHLSKALLASGNATGIQLSELAAPGDDVVQAKTLGMLVSQIRGSCAAWNNGNPYFSPADSNCDPRASSDTSLPPVNRARLGGIDHGSPAVVGWSRYLDTAPWNRRPVVIYAGGHDGMLHAFYASDWDGGTTATWPGADAAGVPNRGLLAPGGTPVVPMQELWAIVPPGQVGLMWTNNALVDGSINVVDVFADFPRDANADGVIDWSADDERPAGQRSWHTVLVATAGKGSSQYGIGGSEMFALDVTNPLNPVLLWHVAGATENDKRLYVPPSGSSSGSWAAFDAGGVPTDPTKYALKWSDTSTTNYAVTGTGVDSLKTGPYDYRNFGLAYSTAVAKIWAGAGYQYALFVATSAADFGSSSTLFSNPWYSTAGVPSGVRGVEVYAIDLVTGRKLWQWEHLYSSTLGSGVDNSVPPRMALGDIDANGSTDRIYVGDLEGHLWELSSRDGRNWNYLLGSDHVRYSFPLFGTPAMTGGSAGASVKDAFKLSPSSATLSQQPLTTPIGQGRFTRVPTDQQPYLTNRLAVLVGTMGVDWTIAPYEAGHIFVIPVSPDMGTRFTEPIDVTATRDPRKFGVLLPHPPDHEDQPSKHAWWDIPLGTGERVYGMPRVSNNQIVFNTAFGSFTGDISATVSDPGKFWSVLASSTGEVTATGVANDSKSFAGVVVVGTTVVVTTDDKIKRIANQVTANDVSTSPFNRATPAAPKTWETWLEVRQ